MRAEPRLSESELHALFRAVAALSIAEAGRLRQRLPRAHAWTDVWCELRHAFAAAADGSVGCHVAIVTVTHNRRTGRTSDSVLIAAGGSCPSATARDLLRRLDRHAQDGTSGFGEGLFPVGMLGTHTVGQA